MINKVLSYEFNEEAVRQITERSYAAKDLDEWIDYYNNYLTHQGKMCCGRTPVET